MIFLYIGFPFEYAARRTKKPRRHENMSAGFVRFALTHSI